MDLYYLLFLALTGTLYVLGSFFFSRLIAPSAPDPAKQAPYECGMPTIGPTYIRIPIKYYIFAMLFLLFDVEVVFLYPLAVVYREFKILAFVAMAVFIGILIIAYIYIWKKGALEWE